MPAQTFPVKRLLAEFIGTFVLTFAVSASLSLDYAVPTALVAAFVLMTLAYLFGPISGAHVNPAVTIGLFSLRKMTFQEAIQYIIAQLLGAFAASLLLQRVLEPRILEPKGAVEGVIGELLGAFLFVFGVSMVVQKRVDESITGIVVGLSLFTGIAVASAASLGVINPAVALGIGVINPFTGSGLMSNLMVYALVPIIGGYLGALAAEWFASKK